MCEIMAHQEVPEPQGATADVFTLITRAASETAGIEDLQAFLRAATANPEEVGATLDASPWSAVAILRLRALRDLTPLGQMLVVAMIDTGSRVVLESLMSEIGQIRIEDVRAKTSTAAVVSGGPPARGDLLQLN